MLAVAKTPLTKLRIEGEIPERILNVLQDHFGKNLQVKKSPDDELVSIQNTAWYKKQKKRMTPGKEIRGHRELLGMTQSELGQKLGDQNRQYKSRQYISDLENDRRAVSKQLAKQMSEIFQVSVERFL